MSLAKPKTKKKTLQEVRPGWMMWGIPKPLQQRFKIQCIRNGVTMRAALQELLEGYVHGKNEESNG